MSFLGIKSSSLPGWLVRVVCRLYASAEDLDKKLFKGLGYLSALLVLLAALETLFHLSFPGVISSHVDLWSRALLFTLVYGLTVMVCGALVRSVLLFHRCRKALLSTTDRSDETWALWRATWLCGCDATENLLLVWPCLLAVVSAVFLERFDMVGPAAVMVLCVSILALCPVLKEKIETACVMVFLPPIIFFAILSDFVDSKQSAKNAKPGEFDWEEAFKAIPRQLRDAMDVRIHAIVFGASHALAFRRAMVKSFNGGHFEALEQARMLRAEVPQVKPSSLPRAVRRI